MHETSVDAMRSYYALRATYYERVYLKPHRQAELRAMQAWLPTQFMRRHVLEIACGTGWWTGHGARDCASWLATDLNPETMAIARAKPLPEGKVRFHTLDAYTLDGLGDKTFDGAFAGCWWSHVPLSRLDAWIATLHGRLHPGARMVLLDNRYVEGDSTPIARRDAEGNGYQLRTLDDGSMHEVLKNYPTREEAIARLGPHAREPEWTDHPHYWTLAYTFGKASDPPPP